MTYETLLNQVHIQMYVHLKLSFNVPFITHLAIKVKVKVKVNAAYPPALGIIDSKTIETPTMQPHTHTDTDGMMSDPTGAATHRVHQSTSRTKMTCPDPRTPPPPSDPGTRRLSGSILRSARYQDRGQRRGRQQAIPAQKKSTGPQGAHQHQPSLIWSDNERRDTHMVGHPTHN